MPVERQAICPECGKPCQSSVKHGLDVRHGDCHLEWLRGKYRSASEFGKAALAEIAACVTQNNAEWEKARGKQEKQSV